MKVHEYQAKEILRGFGVTTPRGQVTDSPEEARQIAKELGGMEIEEVAAKDPTAIVKEPFDPSVGLLPFQARKLCYALALALAGETHKKGVAMLIALAKAYVETDAALAEINPLLITGSG